GRSDPIAGLAAQPDGSRALAEQALADNSASERAGCTMSDHSAGYCIKQTAQAYFTNLLRNLEKGVIQEMCCQRLDHSHGYCLDAKIGLLLSFLSSRVSYTCAAT